MDEWTDGHRDRKINELEMVMETKTMGKNIHSCCLAVDKGDEKNQKDTEDEDSTEVRNTWSQTLSCQGLEYKALDNYIKGKSKTF